MRLRHAAGAIGCAALATVGRRSLRQVRAKCASAGAAPTVDRLPVSAQLVPSSGNCVPVGLCRLPSYLSRPKDPQAA